MKAHISPSLASLAASTELQDAGMFLRVMQAQGRHPLVRFLHPSSIILADQEVSAGLGVPFETPILHRTCLHLIERIPYRIMESYYPASLLGELQGHDREDLLIFQWLSEHKDIHATRAVEKLNCRMPSAQEAVHLHINRGQPVMEIERQVWAQQNQVFEYSHIVANGMLHDFTYAYTVANPSQSKYGV